jgi:putative ABC transport system permease protein
MNIKELAFQNVKGNWRSYKMFFLSSCFSIFAFYMYMSVIFHPYMNIGGEYAGIAGGLYFCSFFILLFSIVFTLYSSSIFIQARKKEFGLYILMGAMKQHIIAMMMLEQMIMGLGATIAGIFIGTMFLKLFFMIFSVLLNMLPEMPFIFSVKAVLITVGIYGLLFSLLSVYNALKIWKFDTIHLIKEIEKKKKEPKNNRWFALFGVVYIGMAYILTMQTTMKYLIIYFPVVSFLTTVGTYFVCKHGVIGIVYRVKKQKKVMYRYPYMFVVNQLVYRIKDHRRFFFLLSMATTFVVTATGTVYLYISGLADTFRYDRPHTFSYIEQGENGITKKEKAEKLFQKYAMNNYRFSTFTGLLADVQFEEGEQVIIISATEYNREAVQQEKPQFDPEEGRATYVYSNSYMELNRYSNEYIYVTVAGEKLTFGYDGAFEDRLFDSGRNGIGQDFLIVHEDDFQNLAMKVSSQERYIYNGFALMSWENTEDLGVALMNDISNDGSTNNYLYLYQIMYSGGRLVLFVGSFISVFFFLVSCSMTYFKWFFDIEYDRKQYQTLNKIGMARKEIYKVLRLQLAIPFFFPIIVGCMHSAVAMYTFTHVFEIATSLEVVVIVTLYVIACIIYFLFAQREYMKQIG